MPAHADWLLFIYRVPSEPSNNRVSVWRELKRLGALYLQQCVCILPALPECERGLESASQRVETLGVTFNLFRLTQRDGDWISLGVSGRSLNLEVGVEELTRRREAWTPAPLRFERGHRMLYQRHATQAPQGVDFDFLRLPSGSAVDS